MLPFHRERPKRGLIDFSEPFFGISTITGFVGLIIGIIFGETTEIFISIFCSITGLWRVRKLGKAKRIMESVDEFRFSIDKFKMLMGIMDVNNKTSQDIQNELFELIDKYQIENERKEKNNKIALFYTFDYNRDGELNNDELKTLKQIMKDE